MHRVEKERVRSILRSMLFYYYENIGGISKICNSKITPKLIAKVTERYLELGGQLPSEEYEEHCESNTKVELLRGIQI